MVIVKVVLVAGVVWRYCITLVVVDDDAVAEVVVAAVILMVRSRLILDSRKCCRRVGTESHRWHTECREMALPWCDRQHRDGANINIQQPIASRGTTRHLCHLSSAYGSRRDHLFKILRRVTWWDLLAWAWDDAVRSWSTVSSFLRFTSCRDSRGEYWTFVGTCQSDGENKE